MATEHDTPAAGAAGAADLDAETSLRDDLDAAFEQHATDETAEPKPAATGAARDAQGRFAPSKAQEALSPAAPEGATEQNRQGQQQAANANQANQFVPGQQQAAATPPAPELKAPASWRPEVREKWGSVDPDVRAEVHRRENEAQRVMQQSAQQRQFVDAFERLMQPYEMFIRAENSNPLAAVDNMMRTAAQLRVGTPAAKVEIVAGIIKNFGIDLPALDAMLAGQQPQHAPQQPQQFQDPRLDMLLAQQQQAAQAQAQFENQSIRQGLAQFAQGHEFYGDVANIMADIVEIQTRQGMPVDLEKVYQRACQMHDGVSTIMQQRATASTTGTTSRAVLRAKRAAQSLKSDPTPHGATVPKSDSLRDTIEAAIGDLSAD